MTEKATEKAIGSGLAKFSPDERADLANCVEQAIAATQVTASRQKDAGVKEALEARIKRLQTLFIKVRQDL